jgi:hypothetical protein
MRTEQTGPSRFSDETVHGNANGVLSASPGLARRCAGLIVLAACALPDRASGASSVQFSTAMFLADENRSPAQVAVQRAGDLTGPLTVSVTTTNGTALAGEDYLAVSAAVTFAPGETNKVVEIPLLNDYFAETDKTVVLRFKDLPGGVTSTQLQSTLLILDDDRPGSIDLSWRSTLGMPEQKPNDYFYAPSMVQPDGMIMGKSSSTVSVLPSMGWPQLPPSCSMRMALRTGRSNDRRSVSTLTTRLLRARSFSPLSGAWHWPGFARTFP